MGLLADLIGSNRRLIENLLYRIRKIELGEGRRTRIRMCAADEANSLYRRARAHLFRTHIVLKALRRQGYEVEECFPPSRSFRHYRVESGARRSRRGTVTSSSSAFTGRCSCPLCAW